jgi:hypothetical protein
VIQSPKQARVPKTYESPILKKLGPTEAEDFLLHHAKLGDQGAKDILQLVSPKENDSK